MGCGVFFGGVEGGVYLALSCGLWCGGVCFRLLPFLLGEEVVEGMSLILTFQVNYSLYCKITM